MMGKTPPTEALARGVSIALGAYAAAGGVATLVGWFAKVPRLTDWEGSGIAQMPNAALCALCAGSALVLLALGVRRALVAALGAFVAAVGAATLFEHFTGIDLGIDQFLVTCEWGQRGALSPGRMGPPGSTSWTLLGLTLALAAGGEKARRAAVFGALLAAGIAMLSLVGYVFRANPLFEIPKLTAIAIQTATMIFALAVGIIAALPEQQPMKTFAAPTTAGELARRFLPLVMLVPVAVGWVRLRAQEAGLFDTAFGTALHVLAIIGLLSGLMWWAVQKVAAKEEALRIAKDEAEAASRAKDNFLAQLSHELRTPLTPVLMSASVLRDDETVPAPVREQLAMIVRNVGLEARLIDDLLDLTRIARGKLALRAEPCDLHSLLGNVVQIVREDAREKRVDLALELAAHRSHLTGDPARLQQVFWNLLRNAVKFTPAGGHIRLSSHDGACSNGDEKEGRFCVTVSDDGIGFNPAAAARLFQPFEQDGANNAGGLGLGLAIAHAIVELHGGEIHGESPGRGHGATFTVELPGAIATPAAETRDGRLALAETPHEAPMRLLLVEDHAATLEVLSRLLQKAGHLVTTATTVADARTAAASERFDAVISDLGLPDGTGIELMEHLRATHGLTGIALSGYGMEEDLRRSREAGFATHLVKPVDVSELHRALRVLASHR